MIELKTCDVTTDEQETTVNFGRKDDRATVYSNDPTVLTKISKCLNTEGSQWLLEDIYYTKEGNPSGYRFSCPKALVKFSPKKKTISEEQRAALVQRMTDLRSSQEEDAEEEE